MSSEIPGVNSPWRKIRRGGLVPEGGGTAAIETGSWRTNRPIVDFEKCTNCMICWIFCPDDCFEVDSEVLKGIDLDHCKGCGICRNVCPVKCIDMISETESVEVK
jgi:pyruvate ferredoxin oxidoreductase delta subunit